MTSATVQPASTLKVFRIHDSHSNEVGAHDDEARIDTRQDVEDLQCPVGPGETLYWELEFATTGDEDLNLALIVKTPPHPNGGFQILSSANGIFLGRNYGADYFNAPAGIFRSQEPGTLLGYGTITVRGTLANGPQPGLLKFQLAIAEPGLLVAVVRTFGVGTHTFYRLEDDAWVAGAVLRTGDFGNLPWRPGGTLPKIYVVDTEGEDIDNSVDLGDTFTPQTPHATEAADDFMGDCTGRVWNQRVKNTENDGMWYSTDDFATATRSQEFGANEDYITGSRSVAIHPTDMDRIAVPGIDDVTANGDLLIYVTTNRGTSWTRTLIKTDMGFIIRGAIVWLQSGRLVLIVHAQDLGILYNFYSDNDGATWTESTLLSDIDTIDQFSLVQMPRNLYDRVIFAFSYLTGSAVAKGLLYRSQAGATYTTINLPDDWPEEVGGVAYDPERDLLWASLWEETGLGEDRGLYKLQSPLSATASDWTLMTSPGGSLDFIIPDSLSWIPAVTP